MKLPDSISPIVSANTNVVAAAVAVFVIYVAQAGLPAPFPHDWSVITQAQAEWLKGLGEALLGSSVVNGWLHSYSSDKAGPLVKG